ANPCSNMTCMFMCVAMPDGARCLCDDDHKLTKGNPGCYGPKVSHVTPQVSSSKPTTLQTTENDSFLSISQRKPDLIETSNVLLLETTTSKSGIPSMKSGSGQTSTSTLTAGALSSSSSSSSPQPPPTVSTTAAPPSHTPAPPFSGDAVESCDLCANGGTCLNITGLLFCLCKDGDSCLRESNHQGSTRKRNNSVIWIPAVVVAVTSLIIFVTVAVVCYFKRKRGRSSLMTAIAFKNPNFALRQGDKDNLVARVSFGGTFFREDEVDQEADCTLSDDWWRRLLSRSRITLDSPSLPKPDTHRSISTVEEVDELEEEAEEEVEDKILREVGRRGRDKIVSFRPGGGGSGKDPQFLETSDRSRLLI
ncbi:hypothetical protein RRG08_053818, partial [Elysia crispata]